ncbi:MAG: FAD-dependent monooxygenase [Pseudomonadota bacterium]|nr:FAD-dependent monooxygenase [Pseudomonadota bacterium]
MTARPKIVVIGGGLGGAAAALALHRRGFEVQIYEKSAELGEIGAGLNLSPNAIKAFRYLGIEESAVKTGFQAREQLIRSYRSGRIIARPRRAGDVVERYGATFLTMHRADLLNMLVAALPDTLFHTDAECVGVEQRDNGAVAIFADGKSVEADVIIGADGIHSVVRDSLFGETAPRFTGCICWRGLVPGDALPDPSFARQMIAWWGPHGHIVHYPVRREGELVNFVAHYDSEEWTEESWTHECDRSEIMETYARWNPDLLGLIQSSEKYYKWALYDRDPLAKWTIGRVTLLGDSVHPMLPYLGQGACMAIEDGCVLAEAIAHTTDGIELALANYECARKPRTTRAQLGSRVRARQNHLVSPFARFRRDVRIAWNSRFGADSSAGQAAAFYDYDVARDNQFN